jgi:acyl-CoA thioester hydrolase
VTVVAESNGDRRLVQSYPWISRVTLKRTDLAPSGLVSAIAIATLLEEGRYQIRSAIDHPHARDRRVGFVLARIAVDLLEPAHYPGAIHIAIGVGRVGRTSFDYVAGLFQDNRCVALSDATVAVRDRGRATGSVLPASFHDTLRPLRYPGRPAADATAVSAGTGARRTSTSIRPT